MPAESSTPASPIEPEIVADPQAPQVPVTDFALSSTSLMVTEITVGNRSACGAERGLLPVSRFAFRWGTSHEAGGRAVWFRFDQPNKPRDLDDPDKPDDEPAVADEEGAWTPIPGRRSGP